MKSNPGQVIIILIAATMVFGTGMCLSSDDIYYEVIPSKTTVFAGEEITVIVGQVDNDAVWDYCAGDLDPKPTPTPDCPPMGVSCDAVSPVYPGDFFTYSITACNGIHDDLLVDIYVVLEIDGQYWFYPTWIQDIDHMTTRLPACDCLDFIVLDFPWSEESGSGYTLNFWNLMTRAGTFEPLGPITLCTVEIGTEVFRQKNLLEGKCVSDQKPVISTEVFRQKNLFSSTGIRRGRVPKIRPIT